MLIQLIAIFSVHFIADFLLQTRWMGENKSHSHKALLAHIGVYTACLSVFGWQYALINGSIHMVVDFFSSRASSYFYKKKQMHYFWAVIGADQLLHNVTLLITWNMLLLVK